MMKIKTRNEIFTSIMFLALLILIGLGILFGFEIYSKTLSHPSIIPESYNSPYFLLNFNFIATIASVFILLFYSFIILLEINVEFEKTQSTEIVYFVMFLFSIILEGVRLFTPLFNLWNGMNELEIYVTKTLIFARSVAPLSLLFSIVYSSYENRQNIPQYLAGVIVFSMFLAAIVPVNTGIVLPIGALRIGFGKLIYTMLLFVLLVSIFSMLLKIVQNHQESKILIGFTLLTAGYFIEIQAYSILTSLIGTVMLFTGSFFYLKALHRQYLWN